MAGTKVKPQGEGNLSRVKSVNDMVQTIRATQKEAIALPARAIDDTTLTLRSKRREAYVPPLVQPDDFYKWMANFKWEWNKERKKEVDKELATIAGDRVARSIANSAPPNLPFTPSSSSSSPSPSPPKAPASNLRRQYLNRIPPQFLIRKSSSAKEVIQFTTEFFEVKKSPKKGHGAFAVKDIETGTVIMAEAPLFKARPVEVFTEWERLTSAQRAEYGTLYGHMALNTDKRMAIFMTNRFEMSEGKAGIFIKSSRFNHACKPYATCSYRYDHDSNCLIVTATHNIKKGQEITISYTPCPGNLFENYGFYCDCPGCPPVREAVAIANFFRGGV